MVSSTGSRPIVAQAGSRAILDFGDGTEMDIAKLALEDGTVYVGRAFGARGEVDGEVVFNTSMTGYQEILTDPSYHGQIVTMTYPLIGNTGVNSEDAESGKPWVRALIVRELSRSYGNQRAESSLNEYMARHGVLGIEGLDTRSIVRRTRLRGALKGIVSSIDLDDRSLVEKARRSPGLTGRNLAGEVMPSGSRRWDSGFESAYAKPFGSSEIAERGDASRRPHVVALDFGMKWNIPRHLVETGCRVTVLPGSAATAEILEHRPDGIFLSNGPGDPAAIAGPIDELKTLIRQAAESRGLPIFGICLGHQLLGLALGASTFKLKFGHRGANHPVRDERTGKVEITTQNHGFAVDPSTLPSDVEATHVNLNDRTLEGIRHRRLPILAVQYHPEASAGPRDSAYLFQEFRDMMK